MPRFTRIAQACFENVPYPADNADSPQTVLKGSPLYHEEPSSHARAQWIRLPFASHRRRP